MQPNNFRGFSSNNRYNNQNQQIFNQFNYQRNQNNLFLSNSNSNSLPFGNSLQNSNNFMIAICFESFKIQILFRFKDNKEPKCLCSKIKKNSFHI